MQETTRVTVAPAVEPVTLASAATFLRVTPTATTLTDGAAIATATSITVDSSTGFSVGDTIAIGDETAVVATVPDGTTITFTPALPVAVPDNSTVSVHADYGLIAALITSARVAAEHYTRRAFINQTIQLTRDALPYRSELGWWDGVRQGADIPAPARFLELPRPPLVSVSSVQYYDTTDSANTFASSNYFVETGMEPGRVSLNYGAIWPVGLRGSSAIVVTYVAGYGSTRSSVPAGITEAIKRSVALPYSSRTPGVQSERVGNVSRTYTTGGTTSGGATGDGASLDNTVRMMLDPYRVVRLQ